MQRLFAIPRFPLHLEFGHIGQQSDQPPAKQNMIIHNNEADGIHGFTPTRSGTRS